MFKEIFDNVRKTAPLIHHITNYVTANDVANMMLAAGGRPIMADDVEEAAAITAGCQGLNINIGTINGNSMSAMLMAGRRAGDLGHIIVLDPVGAGASPLRNRFAGQLLTELPLTVVRGNMSEIKALQSGSAVTHGVDADAGDLAFGQNVTAAADFLSAFAARWDTIVAVTGPIDLVCSARNFYVISNGRPEMRSVTGCGCMLSGLVAAFVAANPDDKLAATAAAVCLMGYAGEVAWSRQAAGDGNAAYRNRIIDAVYNMTGKDLEAGARYEFN